MGRYVVGDTNALLAHIRERDGGVLITYVGDALSAYALPHGMVDFSAQSDGGFIGAIGYSFYATVSHNEGVYNTTYTGNYIGGANAIHYIGVEGEGSSNQRFRLTPDGGVDYKIARQSKIYTDVAGAVVFGQGNHTWTGAENPAGLSGQLLYRAGSGTMDRSNADGSMQWLYGAYNYITGGVSAINGASSTAVTVPYDYRLSGVSAQRPLPFEAQPGDSGSPTWVWNTVTGQYEFLGSMASISLNNDSQTVKISPQWTVETMESYDKGVSVVAGATAHIYSASTATGETITDGTRTANPYKGRVTDGQGNVLAEYIGVKSGINTWNDLSPLKDTDNWYAYGADYFNASDSATSTDTKYSYADLLQTQNLVFTAQGATMDIAVEEDTDLGLGYVRLSKAAGVSHAEVTISGDHLLNSAGYIVDAGVSVNLQLTNSADYMREWRKTGDGDLHITGSGDTNALLNVGGNGTTYLERTDGYSAYNVLANNGTRVVIKDIGQIKRDFTFGFRGGVLDMNGNSMTWNNANGAEAVGFTIHALDEQAVITNAKADSTTTLTWTQGGTQTWLGSFADTQGGGALQFVYNGGAGAKLTLHSIHTDLHNPGSGITVQSGTLVLSGTNTVHALGSATGTSMDRYTNEDDWHYADMRTPVTVQSGGTFELGSHARLTGDVSIATGGAMVIREGVKHRYEYVEGAYVPEDTYAISDFYGLHGNITNNGTLTFEYSEGTTATNTYAGNISGSGSLTIKAGTSGGILTLTGANTLTGDLRAESGGVILANSDALGASGTWQIGQQAWLAVEGVDQTTLPGRLSADSAGALALSQDTAGKIGMSAHADLFLGAEAGKTVQYGTAGTALTLDTWHVENGRNQWLFGGGGGEIVVNWKLTGDNDIVLGNEYMGGTVTITNALNDFSGNVLLGSGSKVVLNFTNASAMGQSHVGIGYGNAVGGGSAADSMLSWGIMQADSAGVLLVDDSATKYLDLSNHSSLHLGVRGDDVHFTGTITVARGGAYRFGGPGTLVLDKALVVNGANDLIADGQGFSGGGLVLNKATNITGNVKVMGYDADRSAESGITSGDFTLVLAADNALTRVASVQVKDGGLLGIAAGSTQTLNALSLGANGSAVLGDASSLEVGTLNTASGSSLTGLTDDTTLTVGGGSVAGELAVGTLVKTNAAGTLALSASNGFGTLDIRQGRVDLGADVASTSTITMGGGALHYNGHTVNAIVTATGNATLYADVTSAKQTAALDAAVGSTLSISGSEFTLSGADTHLASGGSLNLEDLSKLKLQLGGANQRQSFNGTVTLGNTTLYSESGWDNMTYEFKELNIKTGRSARLEQQHWNTVWNIHSLTGSGNLTWESATTHNICSVLKIDRAGDFSGTVALSRTRTSDESRTFEMVLEVGHDRALQNAAVELMGWGTTGFAAMAINTEHAVMKGVSGNEASRAFAVIYAGAAFTSPQANAPVSTRNAVLELTGSDNYIYKGGVIGDATNAISLLKTGSGTQAFTNGHSNGNGLGNNTASFRDVTVLGGSLYLNNTVTNVYGDYGIGQGAMLDTLNGITLTEGHSLIALNVEGKSTTARLSSALTLAGGTLGFSGAGLESMASGTYLLSLYGGVTLASGQSGLTIAFTDVSSLQTGKTYYLASGNFAGLGLADSAFTASGLDYYDARFTATSSGLTAIFTDRADALVWDGTAAAHAWSGSVFGSHTPSAGTIFNFTDSAAVKDVQVTGDASFGRAVVDAKQNYTISGHGGGITLTDLEKKGSGDLTIDGGLTVTGTTTLTEGRIVLGAAALQGTISGAGNTLALAYDAGTLPGLSGSIGTVEVMQGGGFQLGDSALTFDRLLLTGGTLQLQNGATTAVSITSGNNSVIRSNGNRIENLTLTGDTTIAVTGSTTLAGVTSLNENAVLTVRGGGLGFATTQAGYRLKLEDGTLTLNSSNHNAFRDLILGSGATLVLAYDTGISNGAAIEMSDGSAIEMKNGNASTRHELNAAIRVSGQATMYGSTNGGASVVSGSINGDGTLLLTNRSDANNGWTLSSTLSDAPDGGTLRVLANSKGVTLSGNNTYSGGTTVLGNLTADNQHALGTGRVEVESGGHLYLSSAQLDLENGLAASASTAHVSGRGGLSIAVAAGDSATYAGTLEVGALLVRGAGAQSFTGSTTVSGDVVVTGTATLSLGGRLDIGGGINVAQTATATLADATLAGDLMLNAGTLTIGGQVTMGGYHITSAGTVSLAEGANFVVDYSAFSDSRYALVTGTGSISLGNAKNAFTVNNFDASALDGQVMRLYTEGNTLYIGLQDVGGLVWTGGGFGDWDKTSIAWTSEGVDCAFTDGSSVTFDDSSTFKSVWVIEPLKVSRMTVTSTTSAYKFYHFGSGSIEVQRDMNITSEQDTQFGLAVTVGGNISVNGAASFTKGLSVGGTLTVGEGSSLTLGGDVELTSCIVNGGTIVFNNDLKICIDPDTFTSKDGNRYDILSGGGYTGTIGLTNIYVGGTVATSLEDFALHTESGSIWFTYGVISVPATWAGTDASHTWGGSNWTSGSAPAVDAEVFFAEAANKAVTVEAAGAQARAVTISAAGYTFSGGAVAVAEDLALEAGASATFGNGLSVGGGISLGAASTLGFSGEAQVAAPIAVDAAGANLDIGAAVTLSGAITGGTLTKAGSGTLTLNSAEASTANLVMNAGNVAMNGSGAWSGDVTVNGGQLQVQSGALTVAGNLTISGGNSLLIAHGVDLERAVTVASGGAGIRVYDGCAATISGAVTGGALTKVGLGALTLTGDIGVSSLTISQGKLTISGTATLTSNVGGSGTLELKGGRLKLANGVTLSHGVSMAGDSYVETSPGATATLSGTVSGGHTLTKEGAGTLNLTGSMANVNLTINGGTVDVGSSTNDGTSKLTGSTIIVNAGGTLRLQHDALGWKNNGIATSVLLQGESETNRATLVNANGTSGSGNTTQTNITLAGHTSVVNADPSSTNDSYSIMAFNGMGITARGTDNNFAAKLRLNQNTTITVEENGELNLSGNVCEQGGNFTLTKAGAGTLNLTGSMENVDLTINGGLVDAVACSNENSKLKGSNVNVNAGGTLRLQHDALGWGSGKTASLVLRGESPTNRATIINADANEATGGSVTLNTNLTLNGHTLVQNAEGKADASFNSFGGNITVTGTDNEFATGLKLRNNININVQGAADELVLSGKLTTYSDAGGAGTGTLTKAGAGTLIVSNTESSMNNAVSVSAGTLKLQGDGAKLGSGAISVAQNATLETAGDITLGNSISNAGAIKVSSGTLTLTEDAAIDHAAATVLASGEGARWKGVTLDADGFSASTEGVMGGISGSLIQLKEGASLTVKELVISADTYIGKATAQSAVLYADAPEPMPAAAPSPTELNAQGAKLRLESGVNASLTTTTLEADVPVAPSLTLVMGTPITSVLCSNFQVDILSGSLLLDFSDIWDEVIANHNRYLMVEFSGVEQLEQGSVISACIGNATPAPAITYGTAGAIAYFDIAAIPEPATATLSLLALAALAARRRRKNYDS